MTLLKRLTMLPVVKMEKKGRKRLYIAGKEFSDTDRGQSFLKMYISDPRHLDTLLG
jgi:hypothetical protein